MNKPLPEAPDPLEEAAWLAALTQIQDRGADVREMRSFQGNPLHFRWLYLADHATYPEGLRARWDRFQAAVAAFPQGFTLWWGEGIPVGYTAWHPVDPRSIRRLDEDPGAIDPQLLDPVPLGPSPQLYVFNYSLIPPLRKAPFSRMLLGELARQLQAVRPERLGAGVVSLQGERVAACFGMTRRGDMKSAGWSWWSS